MKNIILIGMPGCGKTTIGKRLAKKLNMDFFDADDVFEKNSEMRISEFFKLCGEDAFRDGETKTIHYLTQKTNAVISTGGGVVERAENKEILQNGGIVVFINRSPEDIVGDVDTSARPLLAEGKDRIFKLYERRFEKYMDFCHIEIENNGTLDAVLKKITDEVNSYNG